MEPCAQCGQPHQRDGKPTCSAHVKNGERRGQGCSKHPMSGSTVCKSHGGGAPQVQGKARERLERSRAEQAVATYGLPQEIDPWSALLEEIARTNGHVLWLAEQVSELSTEDLVHGVMTEEVKDGGGEHGNYVSTTTGAAPNVLVRLYQEERKHLARVCRDAIACGIAERHVRLAEQQGEAMARLLDGLITDPELGLSKEAQRAARRIAGRHLSVLHGGAAA